MRKCYCSPVAESIYIETFIIAASTDATRAALKTGREDENEEFRSWGDIGIRKESTVAFFRLT
jgi:hypothetical protein